MRLLLIPALLLSTLTQADTMYDINGVPAEFGKKSYAKVFRAIVAA